MNNKIFCETLDELMRQYKGLDNIEKKRKCSILESEEFALWSQKVTDLCNIMGVNYECNPIDHFIFECNGGMNAKEKPYIIYAIKNGKEVEHAYILNTSDDVWEAIVRG